MFILHPNFLSHLNLKKIDRTKLEGFKFWKNLVQTCTWIMVAWILKCLNWTKDSFQKAKLNNTGLNLMMGIKIHMLESEPPCLGLGFEIATFRDKYQIYHMLMQSTQINGTFFDANGYGKSMAFVLMGDGLFLSIGFSCYLFVPIVFTNLLMCCHHILKFCFCV